MGGIVEAEVGAGAGVEVGTEVDVGMGVRERFKIGLLSLDGGLV